MQSNHTFSFKYGGKITSETLKGLKKKNDKRSAVCYVGCLPPSLQEMRKQSGVLSESLVMQLWKLAKSWCGQQSRCCFTVNVLQCAAILCYGLDKIRLRVHWRGCGSKKSLIVGINGSNNNPQTWYQQQQLYTVYPTVYVRASNKPQEVPGPRMTTPQQCTQHVSGTTMITSNKCQGQQWSTLVIAHGKCQGNSHKR